MKQKIAAKWQALSIEQKSSFFTKLIFFLFLIVVLFDIWVVRFSVFDFNKILEENLESGTLLECVQEETQLFAEYTKNRKKSTEKELNMAMKNTRRAVEDLPYDYGSIGEKRFNKTWAIRNFYEVYQEKRDAFFRMKGYGSEYVASLYEVYDMQEYLQKYARELMSETLHNGNDIYREKVPGLMRIPVFMVLLGGILLIGVVQQTELLKKSITEPILELAKASKRIGANDFSGEDIKTDSQDELGELVHAFNKMKYATGEYIQALEEKRKTLDLLHQEELERLSLEKHLELTRMELLKNQINPHFLFNTLNVIGGMANLEEAFTTEKMIGALSSIFRYNLKTTDPLVLLVQEIKVVEDYMYLQEMRFGGRISYEFCWLVNPERIMVPVYTFQPLVENAIIHGLSKKEEGGKIRIRIWEKEEMLFITVGDTGVGMEQEELSALRNKLNSGENKGIGLGNIYKRITSMYQGGELLVFSKKNAGTVIRIKIPLNGIGAGGEGYVSDSGGR